jgi:hypothetical protein
MPAEALGVFRGGDLGFAELKDQLAFVEGKVVVAVCLLEEISVFLRKKYAGIGDGTLLVWRKS